MFFSPEEAAAGARYGSGFVLIEPHVVSWKRTAPNKDWGFDRYQQVADRLSQSGFRVCQFAYKGSTGLRAAEQLQSSSFRDGLSILRHAALYVGPEGGLHHGAAAVAVPGVVLFGGFIPPSVTGYDTHTNLTGGAEACGSLDPCQHCRDSLYRITVDQVVDAARSHLCPNKSSAA